MWIPGGIDGDMVTRSELVNGLYRGRVEHGASAVANLKEVGHDFVEILPDKTFKNIAEIWTEPNHTALEAAMGVPLMLMWDIVDAVIAPVKLAKDAVDSALHGIAHLLGIRSHTY